MTDADDILDMFGDKSRVVARVGRYVGTASGQALIDMDNQRFPAAFLTAYVPMSNEPVHVWGVDGTWFLLGPTRGRPGTGVVSSVASLQATVVTDHGTFTMPYVGTAPTATQVVAILWPGPTCLGALSVQPAAPVVPPDPGGGGTVVKEATFLAIDAGSTDRGSPRWWQAQPWASNTTYGAWFYGNQIKDTVPVGSTLVSAEIYINRVYDTGAAPNFALHDAGTKGPIPGFGSNVVWDPPNGWNALPGGWFAALIGGGAYAGIGLNQGGFNKFASLAQDGFSGALRFKWK